ncbi:MAG: pilus assembly protein TadG-related protein, partial [Gemmatimonadota bacterium]
MIKRVEVRPRNRQTRQATAWWRSWAADQRGSVTVMVALTITGLMALLALAIDLSALFDARSEAQRAADSAALAGASAFLEYQQDYARSVAIKRAMEYATKNEIRNTPIDSGDVTIAVDLDSSTVQVQIRRNGVPTWFARLFGINAVDIGADATAWAGEAGAAQCVKPFALPDMWQETTQDLNHNRIWDPGERWQYNPADGDRYVPYSGPGGGSNETGYGSDWRDGYTDATGRTYTADYGRRVTVKTTDPNQTMMPSFFLPWVLPIDGDQPDCGAAGTPGSGNGGGDGGTGGPGSGGDQPGNGNGNGNGWFRWVERRGGLGGSNGQGANNGGSGSGGGVGQDNGAGRGAARYRRNICSCNNSIIDLD